MLFLKQGRVSSFYTEGIHERTNSLTTSHQRDDWHLLYQTTRKSLFSSHFLFKAGINR